MYVYQNWLGFPSYDAIFKNYYFAVNKKKKYVEKLEEHNPV